MVKIKSLFKRLTSASLSLLLAASMANAVSAKSFEDVDIKNEFNEQIDLLSDIGVILGTSDTEFSPDDPVTREQMALFLYRLMLGRNNTVNVNSTPFTDITNDTYFGAISWAYASGYILGTSDTTFDPQAGITHQDAMTILVRALGQSNTNMNKGYPWTFIDAGIKLSLDNALDHVDYTEELTRGEVAAMLYNALTAEYLIPKTASNGNTYLEKTSIIEKVFGYEITDATLVATNSYALGDRATVIKNGYVTLTSSEITMTVDFADLGLSGTPNDWLGRELRVIYKPDVETKQIKVLGSAFNGRTEKFNGVTFGTGNTSVTIGGESYNIVTTLSDSLATNANELIVYKYDNDGTLAQVTSNAELASMLGFYEVELIFDSRIGTVADRAIVKNYTFGRLSIDTAGKINIAGNLTTSGLTGGFVNTAEAVSGDHVLYYFNSAAKALEIVERLPITSGFVSKISGTNVTIGGIEYAVGSAPSGVDPAALLATVTIGREIAFVAKDGKLLAVVNAPVMISDSEYLVTMTNATPVFADGMLKYVVTANVGGTNTQIFVSDPTAAAGKVYRFIKDINGIYVLFDSESLAFTQQHESSTAITLESDATLTKNANPYYTLNGVNFVTDANSLIVVNNNGIIEVTRGRFDHTIAMKGGATITAVFKDEAGSVETLSFLYVSNGHIENARATTAFVKVIAHSGYEYVDGAVLNIYTVYNYETGKVEEKLSLNGELAAGSVLALDTNSFISMTTAGDAHKTGVVTGHTGTTVTIGETIYALAEGVKITSIDGTTVTAKTIADALDHTVEIIVNGNTVVSMIIGAAAE